MQETQAAAPSFAPKAASLLSLLTTGEVADDPRVKERMVHEMIARPTIPFSRATGKILFRRRLVAAWLNAQTDLPGGGIAPAPPLYAGSDDPLLEWALRQSGSGLAGFHLLDPKAGDWNRAARSHLHGTSHVMIHWARRTQGLITASGNPLGVTGLKDAAARGLRFATRAGGAGSTRLLQVLLAREGLSMADLTTLDRPAETHADLATLIETGEADLGLGLHAAAGHLGFIPLVTDESFDLAMTKRAYFEPAIQSLLAFARTDTFTRRAAHLGGYDLTDLGAVVWNG